MISTLTIMAQQCCLPSFWRDLGEGQRRKPTKRPKELRQPTPASAEKKQRIIKVIADQQKTAAEIAKAAKLSRGAVVYQLEMLIFARKIKRHRVGFADYYQAVRGVA